MTGKGRGKRVSVCLLCVGIGFFFKQETRKK